MVPVDESKLEDVKKAFIQQAMYEGFVLVEDTKEPSFFRIHIGSLAVLTFSIPFGRKFDMAFPRYVSIAVFYV